MMSVNANGKRVRGAQIGPKGRTKRSNNSPGVSRGGNGHEKSAKESDFGVKYECLLCGNLSPSMNRYIKHYHSCHTEYGANRQCHTCSQYFFSRRNLMRHVRGERCPGRAVIYCYVTGRLFYRGRNPFSSRRGELVTRKSYNENALVAACSELACVQTVPQGKERVTYALRDLPLPNEHGIQPMCVPRDFCPRSPIWPSNVMPPLMTPREPRARDELESMLENAAAVPDQNVEAIALHVMENVDRAEAAAAAELNMPMQNNVAAIEPQPVIDANEIVVILDSNDESENVVNEVPPIGLASSESNKGSTANDLGQYNDMGNQISGHSQATTVSSSLIDEVFPQTVDFVSLSDENDDDDEPFLMSNLSARTLKFEL